MTSTTGDTAKRVPFRGLILFGVTLGSGLQGMDTLLAAVALPNMQGALSVSQDEVSWVPRLLMNLSNMPWLIHSYLIYVQVHVGVLHLAFDVLSLPRE